MRTTHRHQVQLIQVDLWASREANSIQCSVTIFRAMSIFYDCLGYNSVDQQEARLSAVAASIQEAAETSKGMDYDNTQEPPSEIS